MIIHTKTDDFVIKNNNAYYKFNTKKMHYLKHMYLIIYHNNYKDLFDNIELNYNNNKSILTIDFLIYLTSINSCENTKNILNNMYKENPIYLPLNIFFYDKLYVKNQNVVLKLSNLQQNIKMQILYDYTYYGYYEFKNMTIQIKTFKIYKNFDIYIDNYFDTIYEILWYYNKNNQVIHPLENISINFDNKKILNCDFTKFNVINQLTYHTSTHNDIYCCSFVLCPEILDNQNVYYCDRITFSNGDFTQYTCIVGVNNVKLL